MLEKVIHWLESHLKPCSFKEAFGIDCPGCGLQRSVIELLKGHLWESFLLYPALMPIITMFIFLFLHLIFKFKWGAFILKVMFIMNASIIFLHYIYKLIFI
jgi:hypothetical protein